jgi:hypothetical protein
MTIALNAINLKPNIGSAVVVGSISGTVLTVTSVTLGAVAVGQLVHVAGIVAGTTISSLGTGTGGTGTYNLSVTQSTIASTTVTLGRVLVYTTASTAGLTATIFTGTVSNIDDVSKLDRLVTVDRLLVDGVTYSNIFNNIIIPYGGALPMPKLTLLAGEKLFISVSSANTLNIDMSIAVRT